MDAVARVNRDLSVTHGDDAGLYVEFKREAVQNQAKSEEAGRPIFDEFDYCHITVPGGKTKVVERVTEHHKDRFPRHWAKYQEMLGGKTGETLIGTPLDQWPALGVARVMELRALGIHTVDQLANLNDNGIGALGMGGRELKARAAAFLAQATNNSEAEFLAAENLHQAEQIEQLQQQLAQLSAQVKAMQAQPVQGLTPSPIEPYQAQILAHPAVSEPAAPMPPVLPGTFADETTVTLPVRRGRPPKPKE